MSQDQEPTTDEWACTMTLNIAEVRAMYDHFCYAIETWPGAPRRPYEEQVLLDIMKKRMFAMIVDYNFTEL